ncbi:SAM-dependent methyltransferase [Fodinicola feengrottensis]|uniref:SAM-dependent methyltransferase n=1 Tax=Fodinicola feengrottensis TaxID=435914 RepID=A0ABN2FT02_9ACTN
MSTGGHPEIDTSKPSIARVYDYALGGKDNFEVDRQVLASMLLIDPEIPTVARAHRDWSRRVIRWLVERVGIDQFLDCGSGLPTMENTHEVAQQVDPDARVVYVDNDPVVIAHGRALLEDNPNTRFVNADLREPQKLFRMAGLVDFLDLERPAALIQCGTIHHIDQLADQQAIMRQYVDTLVSGSYVAMTHVHDPADGSEASKLAQRIEAGYRSTNATTHWRPRHEIETLFAGLEIVPPGLVALPRWWPAGPPNGDLDPIYDIILGAVAHKP